MKDGFKFDGAARNPADEPTKPKKASRPPPVKLQEPSLDLTAKAKYDDQERMSAQASPRIFQRKQGGWNAKLPEVDLDNHRTSVASTQDSSRNSQGREISLKPGNEGATSIYMSFEPTWTAQRTSNKRELVFVVVNTNDPAYKIESQSGDAHDSHLLNGRAQSHTTQGSRFTKAIRWGSDDHYRVEFEPASLVRDEFRELEVSRRVIWQ